VDTIASLGTGTMSYAPFSELAHRPRGASLVVLASGPDDALDQRRPVFDALGPKR
jgi:3-hydroxyisobutyrate dehydrogenase-like beta-hydroxyacid dehydrogenase